MIYGLGAALGWGLADFWGALVARRIGSLTTTVFSHLASLVAVGIVVAIARPAWDVPAADMILIVGNGAIAAWAYVLLYRCLELGTVALVSPIVAAYPAVTLPLAIALLGETLTALALGGAFATIVGVILASTDLRRVENRTVSLSSPGVPQALGSMFLFGIATFTLGRASQEVGWIVTVAISRTTATALLLALAAFRRASPTGRGRSNLLWAAGVGLVDIFGVAMFGLGAETGLISIVAAVSGTFPVIPVLGGITLLGERLVPNQAAGVVLVIAGLLLLGLNQ